VRNARTRFNVAILATVASLLLLAATAPAATITGFADQAIGRSQASGNGWGPNAHAVADALAGQVTQARYNLVWDFTSLNPGDARVADFNDWLAAVARHVRTIGDQRVAGPLPRTSVRDRDDEVADTFEPHDAPLGDRGG